MVGTRLDMACRVCGGRDVELFLDLTDQPHCNRLIPPNLAGQREPHFPLRAGFCHQCTLVQIDYTIPKESMFSDYPYVSGTTKTLVAHFKETSARLVARYGFGPSDLVVDIGSNDGTWLKQYEPFGLRRCGVEPASNVVELAHAAGVPTLNRFFNEETADVILAQDGPASLITAAGVFFHLEELHSVVRGITKLLKKDGVFVVQAIYLGGMINNVAFDQIYHEHLCYYTLCSLQELFSRHGLEIFDVDVVSVHGGSLEAHVGFPGAHPISDAVTRMQADEEARGYGRFETYLRFAENVWHLRDDLLALLERLHAEGKTVHAYGAPAKGATLLNAFGIGPRLVQYAAEKNPLKYGKLIPGARIPIVEEGSVPVPDAYLVLAWNFIDEFLARERAYLENGGAFIVPVPELRMITAADLPAGA
ncbi:class I SAM-dependent methyltransferase [Methylobacterium aquaticum]|jgi:C-methyltransferase C-terminal domain/Putative zinc binding domain/Methyltransferase domain|uniref:class I SAM-dependent methyltransferase n=1 Tax=Methylobacterium aquaticum TaxID=270351 RepID=UPI003D177501